MRGKVEKNKNSKTVRKFSEMIKRDGSTEKGKGSNTVEQRKKEREKESKKERKKTYSVATLLVTSVQLLFTDSMVYTWSR